MAFKSKVDATLATVSFAATDLALRLALMMDFALETFSVGVGSTIYIYMPSFMLTAFCSSSSPARESGRSMN